jgi:hypothetical protein
VLASSSPPLLLFLPFYPPHDPCQIHLQALVAQMHMGLEVMKTNIAQMRRLHPSHPPPLFVTPTLSHTLTYFISPPHFTWHPSLMHFRPIADVLRPRIPTRVPGTLLQHCPGIYHHIFDCGRPLACRTHKPFPICWQWYLQAASADAAVFAMHRSGHVPDPTLDGLPGPPDSPAPANHHTDFACLWCHSEVTLLDVLICP